MTALAHEIGELLSQIMLLKLRAWQSGESELAEVLEQAEGFLRIWLEAE